MVLEKSALRHKACLRLRTHILALQFLGDVWAELDTSIHMAQNMAGERCCTFNSLLRYLIVFKDCGLAAKYCQGSALAEATIQSAPAQSVRTAQNVRKAHFVPC